MQVTDFYRSWVRFTIDLLRTKPKTVSQPPPFTLNNARFTLECVARVTPPGGATTRYVLSSSCKAEQVNVREDIWHEPAADMCLIATDSEFLVVKSWDRNNRGVLLSPPSLGPQPERQAGKCADCFTQLAIEVRETAMRRLHTTEEIVAAVLHGVPLFSRSEFKLVDGTLVSIDFPVKVINASEREVFYQVDTGPVLVPDPTAFDGQHEISKLRLAFIAHNSLGCTELLVNVPTPIADGLSVNHYSRVLKVESKNLMFALE